MYTHEILRVEPSQSREGSPELFVDVQITHDTLGIINYARWFTGAQAVDLIANPTSVAPLIETLLPGVIAQKQLELSQEND